MADGVCRHKGDSQGGRHLIQTVRPGFGFEAMIVVEAIVTWSVIVIAFAVRQCAA